MVGGGQGEGRTESKLSRWEEVRQNGAQVVKQGTPVWQASEYKMSPQDTEAKVKKKIWGLENGNRGRDLLFQGLCQLCLVEGL